MITNEKYLTIESKDETEYLLNLIRSFKRNKEDSLYYDLQGSLFIYFILRYFIFIVYSIFIFTILDLESPDLIGFLKVCLIICPILLFCLLLEKIIKDELDSHKIYQKISFLELITLSRQHSYNNYNWNIHSFNKNCNLVYFEKLLSKNINLKEIERTLLFNGMINDFNDLKSTYLRYKRERLFRMTRNKIEHIEHILEKKNEFIPENSYIEFETNRLYILNS